MHSTVYTTVPIPRRVVFPRLIRRHSTWRWRVKVTVYVITFGGKCGSIETSIAGIGVSVNGMLHQMPQLSSATRCRADGARPDCDKRWRWRQDRRRTACHMTRAQCMTVSSCEQMDVYINQTQHALSQWWRRSSVALNSRPVSSPCELERWTRAIRTSTLLAVDTVV
jgi:hypothetical protein